MSLKTVNLGRVRPYPRGEYDVTKTYETMDVVYATDNTTVTAYEALKNVPAGTPLSNEEYWMNYGTGTYVPVYGGEFIGNVKFSGSTQLDDATIGNLLVTGGIKFINQNHFAMTGADGKLLADQLPAIDKAYVGLGNVDNVAVKDMTPAFTQSANAQPLISGDTLPTLLGKLAKNVADDMLHIGDGTIHVSSEDRINWDAAYTYISGDSITNLIASMIDIDIIVEDDIEPTGGNTEPNPTPETEPDPGVIDPEEPVEGGE